MTDEQPPAPQPGPSSMTASVAYPPGAAGYTLTVAARFLGPGPYDFAAAYAVLAAALAQQHAYQRAGGLVVARTLTLTLSEKVADNDAENLPARERPAPGPAERE